MTVLYILYSKKFDKFYIGQTNNLAARLDDHNTSDKSTYTSKYRPWELICTLEFNSRGLAMKAEKYLKKKPRSYIKRVIEEEELRKYIIEKYSSAG